MLLLFLIVAYALGVSFFCSLLEAVLFSSRMARLTQQQEAGSRGAALLLEIKEKRVDDAITSILILNTLANTLGASLAGAQANRVFSDAGIGIFSGFLVLGILVGSEIIPKTLGAVYADPLAPFVGRTLALLSRVMTPFLVLTRALTRLLVRGRRDSTSRSDVAAVVDLAARQGVLTGDESTLFSNLLGSTEIRVEDVMTPRTVCAMLPAETSLHNLVKQRDADAFSRVPLYRDSRDNVVGYILLREALTAAARGADPSQPLSAFVRKIDFIPESATAATALRRFQSRREPIAMVTDEHGGIAGLVTLEDVTETLLGIEIVDESDRFVDLRRVATQLRNERLERMRKRLDGPTTAEYL